MHPLILTLILATAPTDAGLANPARDPFASPGQAREAPCEPPSLLCTSWQRVRVTGVVTSPSASMATMDAGNGATYFAREGDRLRNAIVVRIDPERRGVLLREPMPGTVAGFREIMLLTGSDKPVVREPMAADPVLSTNCRP